MLITACVNLFKRIIKINRLTAKGRCSQIYLVYCQHYAKINITTHVTQKKMFLD